MKTPFNLAEQRISDAMAEDENTEVAFAPLVHQKYAYLYVPLLYSVVVAFGGGLLAYMTIRFLDSIQLVREHPFAAFFGGIFFALCLIRLVKFRH